MKGTRVVMLRGRYRMAAWGAALCCGLLTLGGARGQGDLPCPPCLHDQVLQALPEGVEAVVAVRNGAKQRASAAGRALSGLIHESGAWGETIRAWEVLAKTLDWTPERTFDELLGRRASLVMKGMAAEQGPEWALLSEVSGDTERRLRDRLRAAPRGAIAGLSVLAIEDGSFELVVSPGPEGGGAVVLLSPRTCEGMLEELVAALRVKPEAGAPSVGKSCDVVVVWREGRGRSLTITAGAVEAGWDATIVCSAGLVIGEGAKGPVRRWSDSLFRQLEGGSMLGVMSVVGSPGEMGVLPKLPVRLWPGALAGIMGAGEAGLRMGAFVRAVGPTPAVKPTLASGAIGAPAAPEPRMSVVVMTEASNANEATVKGDRAAARFAKVLLTGEAAGDDRAPGLQLEIADRGARSLRFGEGLAIHPDLEPSLTRAFGAAPLLWWTTVGAGSGGWWVASMSPGGAGEREVRALSARETGQVKARLCIGLVRPAAIERWVSAIEPDLLGGMRGAGFVDSVRWDVWLREDGQAEGSVGVRMVVPVGK